MPKPALASGPESLAASREPPVAPPSRRDPSSQAAVPLYTRHTQGTIAAERERRMRTHAGAPLHYAGPSAKPHPRLATAIAAQRRRGTQALADENRWIDEGGRFDPEAVGLLRIGNRKMKRCNS